MLMPALILNGGHALWNLGLISLFKAVAGQTTQDTVISNASGPWFVEPFGDLAGSK